MARSIMRRVFSSQAGQQLGVQSRHLLERVEQHKPDDQVLRILLDFAVGIDTRSG